MGDLVVQTLETPPVAANDPSFVSRELSEILDRTHLKAGEIVDFKRVENQYVGFSAFLTRFKLNELLGFGGTGVIDANEFSMIVDTMNARRSEIVEAANEEAVSKAA